MTKVEMVEVKKDDDDIRVDRWFQRNYPNVSHVSVEKALRKGQIRVDGKRVKASQHVKEGEIVRVPPMVEYVKKDKVKAHIDQKDIDAIQKAVIFKDKDIIVINKPEGLAVQGGVGVKVSVDSLLGYLMFDYDERPKLVHRLDKDTSGLLILARKTSVASRLSKQFKNKEIDKTYWALVVGAPDTAEGKIDMPLLKRDTGAGKEKMVVDKDGDKAVTYYRVLESMSNTLSLLELKPVTGRTHQLRVHMSEIGHPILGDGKYGGKKAFLEGVPSQKMHLHARQVIIPGYKKPFVAELTGSMKKTFEMLHLDVD